MRLYDYQQELAIKALDVWEKHNLVYIAAEERTGKTFVALSIIDYRFNKPNVLIITKKAAIEGWQSALEHFKHFDYTLINYQSIHKVDPAKPFTCCIVDEAHANLSAYPKPSKTALGVQKLVYKLPIIFLSATPAAQSFSLLFHQLNVSGFSPFDHYSNFYKWFNEYGTPSLIYASGGRRVVCYDNIQKEKLQPIFDQYFLFLTRKDTGMFVVEPEDYVITVDLEAPTVQRAKKIQRQKQLLYTNSAGEAATLTIDTISKEMHLLHSIEGGTAKIDDKYSAIFEDSLEKINYIKQFWGDTDRFAIFYEYIAEGELLRRHFTNAKILQGTTYAEGVDLSHLDFAVVYSMNFSAAKYIQRRCRLCRPDRDRPIAIYYLICKGFLSEACYNIVKEKHSNFTERLYVEWRKKNDL